DQRQDGNPKPSLRDVRSEARLRKREASFPPFLPLSKPTSSTSAWSLNPRFPYNKWRGPSTHDRGYHAVSIPWHGPVSGRKLVDDGPHAVERGDRAPARTQAKAEVPGIHHRAPGFRRAGKRRDRHGERHSGCRRLGNRPTGGKRGRRWR